MAINLSQSPYFDDFSSNDNYYQVLFRPATAVQTREVNSLQSMLQDQIAKFGKNIFKDGSVVEGCNFAFDNRYSFVKINDNYANGTAFTISSFQNFFVENVNGLLATIVNTVQGFRSQDPDTNTLYIKYLNSTTFSNGVQQTVFSNSEQLTILTSDMVPIGNVVVFTPNIANPNSVSTGLGYALYCSNGTVYKDGYFVGVQDQSVVIDKYNNFPDGISAGFTLIENIITPEANSILNDNAAGSSNYAAPGAHRYQLIPRLSVVETNTVASSSTSFFSLVSFQGGVPVTLTNDSQYAIIGAEMARRTYETNGDFVVNPFILSTEPKNLGDPLFKDDINLISSLGLGYVKGFRSEFLASVTTNLPKATVFANAIGTVTTASYGSFISVSNFCGDFGLSNITHIELHTSNNYAVTNNVFLSGTYNSNTLIGYAYLRGFGYSSGYVGTGTEIYNAYIFDINMNSSFSFSQVNSLINQQNSVILGIADVIQIYNATTNTYGTHLTDPSSDIMIYPTGQKALKLDGFQNQSYVYRKQETSSFSNTADGVMTVSLGIPAGSASENFDEGGILSVGAQEAFIVTPTSNGQTSNKTGTVNATSTSNVVTGQSTTFLTDYTQGDYIEVNGLINQVSLVSNNSYLTITTPYAGTTALTNTHFKVFPAGVPISFNRSSRSIDVAGNTATFTIGEALNASFVSSIYFDVLRSHAVSIKKILNKHVYVAINCGTHPNGSKGPYSLGFVDVININAIYVNEGLFSNTVPDSSFLFSFNNGQRDDHYELATIAPIASVLNSGSFILVDLNVYTYDLSQGVGFFNGNSYPVDDTNTSNTSAIQTQYIPQYRSTSGASFDLRDSIDFRPFANNSANSSANSTNWGSVATANPSGSLVFYVNPSYGTFLPSPDTNYIADISFYLPRIDKAILTTGGVFTTLQGIPSLQPYAPLNSSTSMTLGIITVPPYPSLSTPDAKLSGRYDYAVTINLQQNNRYTMQDIGALSSRVSQLEYYTSLNSLEQQIQSTQVVSSSSQLNRFTNGFLVDPFQGFNITDTLDETLNCAIDPIRQELRPAFSTFTNPLWTDQEDVPFNENVYIQQNTSCMTINAVAFAFCYNFGRIEVKPAMICSPDYSQNSDVVNNLDLNADWINIPCQPNPGSDDWRNPYGTDWEHWRHYPPILANQQNTSASGNTDSYGNVLVPYQSQTTSNTNASGIVVTNNTGISSNGITIDTDVIDFTRCRDIDFVARGMKANTAHRLFVGAYELTNLCRQCNKGFAEETFKNYGSSIITDVTGTIFGRITIPKGYFKEGSIQFTFLDSISNTASRADGYLQTSFVDQNNWKDIDVSDQLSTYEFYSGISPQYLPGQTLVTIANTPFLNERGQGVNDQVSWNTYFTAKGNPTWPRFPNQSSNTTATNDWNPTYVAQDGYNSFDRRGSDIGRISYGVVLQTGKR
jgi:hypothetical protein